MGKNFVRIVDALVKAKILGERKLGTPRLEVARRRIEDAQRVYQDTRMKQYDETFRQRLQRSTG